MKFPRQPMSPGILGGIPSPHETATAPRRQCEHRPTDVSEVERNIMWKGYKNLRKPRLSRCTSFEHPGENYDLCERRSERYPQVAWGSTPRKSSFRRNGCHIVEFITAAQRSHRRSSFPSRPRHRTSTARTTDSCRPSIPGLHRGKDWSVPRRPSRSQNERNRRAYSS